MKNKQFRELITSVRQAGRIHRGLAKPSRATEWKAESVKKIRKGLGKSQAEFALMLGVSISTLQNWEQGRRRPEGPAQALLRVAATHPSAVAEALSAR